MLQAFDVYSDEGVQLFSEGGKESLVLFEALDEGFTLFRNMIHGFLNPHLTEFHKDNDHVPGLPAGLLHVVRHNVLSSTYIQQRNQHEEIEAHIRPGDDIIGDLLKRTNDWVFKDLIGKIEPVGVFNEGEARLTTTSVTTEWNVGIKVRNVPRIGF
jgi:hypothetical protein